MSERSLTCREAVEQLWALIDQELETADADRVRAHLDRCQHCYPQYDFHLAFREFLAARCRAAAPDELKRKILAALTAEADSSDRASGPHS